MKATILKPVLICFIFLITAVSSAQVDDIGQTFSKKGYIQSIDLKENQIAVNFISKTDVSTELIRINDCQVTNSKKEVLSKDKLKVNAEVIVDGDAFTANDKYNIAKVITLVDFDKTLKPDNNGRIDYIKDDYAFVDGFKVKLKPGEKISGVKKSGYSGKSFKSFKELKYEDFAYADGKYSPEGYYLADDFEVEPDVITVYDKIADTLDRDYHRRLYAGWIDKGKRSKFFNTDIPGIGKINSDAEIQEYVHNLGMKLVPEHMKSKIDFMFVVIDNPQVNANVRPNGLAFVYSGLLKSLENEAQLAAILGHEISHVIYKHAATEFKKKEDTQKNKDRLINTGLAVKNLANKVASRGNSEDDKPEKNTANTATKSLTIATNTSFDQNLSIYSTNQEFQADRVGLSLMILAGYDPKEAPVVWKNLYNKYNKFNTGGELGIDSLLKEMAKDEEPEPAKEKSATTAGKDKKGTTKDKPKENKEKSKPSDTDKALVATNFLMQAGAKSKSFKTHPDEIERFEKLNRIIAMYWSDPSLDNNANNTAEDKYKKLMKRLPGFKKAK